MGGLNHRLFCEAKRYLIGGVDSPIRAFRAVGGEPLFVNRAMGAKIHTAQGRQLLDYCLSFGALILGHAQADVVKTIKEAAAKGTSFGTSTKAEIELARIISEAIASIERVRFVNSGTEAVMTAMRLARAYTKKNVVIRFRGSYHGHADYLLDCPGVPEDFKKYTLSAEYNDAFSLRRLMEKYAGDVAAVIVEPIAGNMGVILPRDNFLKELRILTHKHKALLVFDEVITGFRIAFGAAQDVFGVKPDITTLGKIIGGGLPIGAVGAKKEIMRLLAPEGPVYQAGTFSGNPLSVNAGITVLKALRHKDIYRKLSRLTRYLCENIKRLAKEHAVPIQINFSGAMFSLFFADKEVVDYNSADAQDRALFGEFYQALLRGGIYFSPSGFEADFLSAAHTDSDIEKTLGVIEKFFVRQRRN